MKEKIGKNVRKSAWLLTLVYFGSYLLRINVAVMLVKIGSDLQVEKSVIAIVITGLTVCYGIGQVISGMSGDRIHPKYMITGGLSLAILANIAFYFCKSVPLMTAVWCVNGFAHSMLWPPIVRIMSLSFNDEEYGYASVRVSWGSSFATVFLYALCPILLTFLSWRTILLLCAFGGIAILVTWLLLYPRLFLVSFSKNEKNLPEKDSPDVPGEPLPKYVYLPIALIMLAIALQGSLRDGVTEWMPSYLLETFHLPEEKAIFATVILALFSIVSFYVFDRLHRKIFKNEVFCASVIFFCSLAASGMLYILHQKNASIFYSMLMMAVIVACMHGINLMLITVVPKRFVKSGKVSTFSGLFNAFTYVGASIATYTFAATAENHGWNATVILWILISLSGGLVTLAATPLWKKFKKTL